MIYRVRHTTRYAYGSAVDLAAHMLHLEPRPLPFQRVLSVALHCDPLPIGQRQGVDHFGNRVTWLFLDTRHASFTVTAEARVEVCFSSPPKPEATPPWEEVAAQARAGRDTAWRAAEYVFDSPMLPAAPEAGAYAAPCFPPGRPLLAGLLELNSRIRREFAFRPGATTLVTPVSKVLEQRAGVCQDFSHLMIAALRALGLPARYVSGYLRTRPPPGQKRRQGADVSHAWVSCWLGPDHGWVDLDPTNDLLVREEHVVLGWGRDYSDISPLRGVILGGGEHSLDVGVDLVPEEEDQGAPSVVLP